MGQRASKNKRDGTPRIVFFGLYQSGKTALFHQLSHGEVASEYYHTSFADSELVNLDGKELCLTDSGFREKSRPFFRLQLMGASAVVFVIDSSSRESLEDAFEELHEYYLELEDARHQVCMVLANKQDLDGAMTAQEVEEELKNFLDKRAPVTQTLFVLPGSATTGQGLQEAFGCLLRQMALKKAKKIPRGLIRVDPSEKSTPIPGTEKDMSATKPNPGNDVKKAITNPFKCFKSILFY